MVFKIPMLFLCKRDFETSVKKLSQLDHISPYANVRRGTAIIR